MDLSNTGHFETLKLPIRVRPQPDPGFRSTGGADPECLVVGTIPTIKRCRGPDSASTAGVYTGAT